MGGGVLSEAFAAQLQEVFAEMTGTEGNPMTPPAQRPPIDSTPASKEDA